MADSKPKEPGESRALVIDTALLCRELENGDVTYAPVADRTQVSYGSESSARETQEVFLSEYLLSVRPEELARFCAPPGIELREVDVVLRRHDLPRRAQLAMPITFPCVLVPHKRDTWVIVPTIAHTFYVARGEDLDAVITSEIARVVTAADHDGESYLRLFPAESHELEIAAISIEHKGEGIQGRAGSLRKKLITEHRRNEAVRLLDSVAVPLHAQVPKALPRLIARERSLAQLSALLRGSDRKSVLLVGPPSSGKTALCHAWLAEARSQRAQPPSRDGNPEDDPGDLRVYSTSGAQLVAGMSGLGAWQERITRVMAAVELLDAVLYFENLAELFGERPERGGMNAAGLMRRYIVDGRIRVVGEITPEGLDAIESRHVALLGAFNRLRIEPLDSGQTISALAARITWWNENQLERPRVAPELVAPVVELAERYLPYQAFPGKAIRFVDELRAMADGSVAAPATPGQSPPRPAPSPSEPENRATIDLASAYEGFSLATGIPAFLLREDRALLTEDVIARFRQRMVGQKEAVRRVVQTICVVKARLQPAGKPLCSFLFVGPTGVGKTELARTLAKFLFGSIQRMARFDMSEYTDSLAAERLLGGHAGLDSGHGLLTSKIREQPFCVLLLDEVEKAHPSVLDLLLQVCGEGRLTDARGKVAYFHNAIIIMTSNLGATHRRAAVGLAARSKSTDEHYLAAVQQAFRPELINRLDRVIAFSELTPAEVREVTRIAVSRLTERRGLGGAGIALDISEGALDVLATGGYSETYGVRALRRHLDDHLLSPIARILAQLGNQAKGALVRVAAASEDPSGKADGSAGGPAQPGGTARIAGDIAGELRIDVFRRSHAIGRRALHGVAALAEMRRNADHWLALDRAAGVREHVAFLRSQLASAGQGRERKRKRKRKRRQDIDIGKLQTEYHRLSTLWHRAETLRRDLHAAEELGLAALFDGDSAQEWVEESDAIFTRFRRELLWLLVARQEPRDEATVIVTDIHGAGLFKHWVRPLIEELPRRNWTLWGHVPGNSGTDRGDWPAERRWSPPRDAAWVQNQILHGPSPYREILLRLRGPNAGILLALEAGLHRFRGFHSTHDPAHLLVTLVAMRTELSDAEWIESLLAERPTAREGTASQGGPACERFARSDEIRVIEKDRRVSIPRAEYWQRIEELALERVLYYVDGPDGEERDGAASLFVGALPATMPSPPADPSKGGSS